MGITTHWQSVHPVVMVSHGTGPTSALRVGWRRVLGLWPGNAAAHRWPVPLVGSNHILAAIRRVSVPLLHIWISRIVSHRSVHIWRLKCRCIVLLLSLWAIILISVSLRSIVHFNSASEYLPSLHFLKSAFRILFQSKFNESITLWLAADRITNHFCLIYWSVDLLESLHQHYVGHGGIKITYVNLEALIILLLWPICLEVRLLHLARLTLSGILIVRSRNASTMWSPIEFKASIGPTWDRLPIERLKHVPCSLPIWKLNKAVTYRRSFDFISDELHTGHRGNVVELRGNVAFIHPRLDVTYP